MIISKDDKLFCLLAYLSVYLDNNAMKFECIDNLHRYYYSSKLDVNNKEKVFKNRLIECSLFKYFYSKTNMDMLYLEIGLKSEYNNENDIDKLFGLIQLQKENN